MIRNPRQDPGSRNWSRDSGGMLPTGLFSSLLFSYLFFYLLVPPSISHCGGLGPPHPSSTKRIDETIRLAGPWATWEQTSWKWMTLKRAGFQAPASLKARPGSGCCGPTSLVTSCLEVNSPHNDVSQGDSITTMSLVATTVTLMPYLRSKAEKCSYF